MIERLPREKVIALGEKTVNQYYVDNVVKVLYYTTRQLQTLLNGIIEVQVFFCVGGFL